MVTGPMWDDVCGVFLPIRPFSCRRLSVNSLDDCQNEAHWMIWAFFATKALIGLTKLRIVLGLKAQGQLTEAMKISETYHSTSS